MCYDIRNGDLKLIIMKWRYTHMTKQELALEVIERLKKEYPDADCTLD